MPIYEYECPGCGEKFELFRPISRCEEDAECPACGAANAARIISRISGSAGCDSCASSDCFT